MLGTLYIVATPIGNLQDMTFRAIEVLKNSDYILAESSARTSKLLSEFNIKKRIITFNKDNEKRKKNSVIQDLSEGELYGGGAFLSRKVERPSNAGVVFYNLTFDYWLNEMNNDCILQYSDDWNRVSSIMSYKNGFKNLSKYT